MLAILMINMRLRRRHRRHRLRSEKKKEGMSCCRTCLGTDELHPIFYGKGTEKKRSEELFLVTGTEIKINDGLPQKICSKCVEAMNEALQFRRTSEKARDTLSSLGYRLVKPTFNTTKTDHTQSYEPNVINDFEDSFNNDDFSYLNDNDDFVTNNDIITKPTIEVKKKEDSPYICGICHKQFRMKNTYRAHMRFHTNYCVCELCGKKCRNNNLLTLHKRGRHGMERIHKCAYCDYSAANKEGLVIHERRHTGEKPYVCDHCAASFHRRSNLIQHIAIHLPDKNFQCEQCHKRFHSKKFLQSHKFKMHQLRRYNYLCHLCKSHFTSTDSARKHLTRAHGVAREAQGPVYRVPNAAAARI